MSPLWMILEKVKCEVSELNDFKNSTELKQFELDIEMENLKRTVNNIATNSDTVAVSHILK